MQANIAEFKGLPAPNPFPVYPVSSLREIASEILDRTVFTDPVVAIDTAVQDYLRRAAGGKRTGLAIPVRGDYGTGKTHLLLFAQARLRREWSNGLADVTILSAPATEAPFSAWYLTVVAPLLDRINLPRLFAKLLASTACEVADQVPLTAEMAAAIRSDPLEVYPILRDGLLSRTHVERAMLRAVEAITPYGSEEVRLVLAALPWPQRQEAALRWLAGRKLEPAEQEQLGVTRDLDAEGDAAAVLVAIAGAAMRCGGLFALMIDEFEHLMAEDQRTRTLRNATAIKRLLEGMAGMGALVLVAGHWRAWELLPDFKARFAGQSSIDLLTLSSKETGQLALQYAPQWGERLDETALEAVAEGGGRNIRRVLAILYQLYADTVRGNGPINASMAEAAVETRRRLAAEDRRPGVVIEEAVLAAGGRLARNEELLGRRKFDFLAWRGEELRLVADVCHAKTSAELTRLLDDVSILASALRTRHPTAQSLLVVTGAVEAEMLKLLDDVAGVKALPGEGAGWETALRNAVTAAFFTEPAASSLKDESILSLDDQAREHLRETRVAHVKAAAATRMRIESMDHGVDERSAAAKSLIRSTAPSEPASAYGDETSILDEFSDSMRMQEPSFPSFLMVPSNFGRISLLALSIIIGFFILFGEDFILYVISGGFTSGKSISNSEIRRMVSLTMLLIIINIPMIGLALGYNYQREKQAFIRYQRWGRQKLEEMIIINAPKDEMIIVRNLLIDAPAAANGFRNAFDYAIELNPRWLKNPTPSERFKI